MIAVLRLVVVDCGVIALAVVALALVLRFGRAALDAVPMSRARRATVARLRPVLGAALALACAVLVVRWVLETDDRRAWLALAAVGAVAVAIAWGTLRDVYEGLYVRASGTCAVGDRIRAGTVAGRVQRLGLRAAHVEGADGAIAVVPYRALTAQPLLRAPGVEDASFHVFRMPTPANVGLPEARRRIREAALLHHWASIARHPHVVATDAGELEITVFAVDADRLVDVEAALRRALGA